MASGGTGSRDNWQDRRGMFQRGREVHTPSEPGARRFSETGSISAAVRRASASSGSGSPDKATFPTSGGQRRRVGTPSYRACCVYADTRMLQSSAASNGLFGNLMNQKRGGEGYDQRRASQTEQMNQGGVVSGWFNSTFKGYQKSPGGTGADQQKDQKRGVME